MVMNEGRMVAQIAAETSTREDDVALALYLYQLAQAGRTIAEAAALVGRPVDAVAALCCLWKIAFRDAEPDAIGDGIKRAEIARLEALDRAGNLSFAARLRLNTLRRQMQPMGRLA